ncbi:hypothetical protein EG68_09471 [Paragonimus skrjabini miyazakii]|uniref:MBD domain-containing protein n=1 Tax=Paragonimus skrjabini miyazakii TaxID=59628 RepID=A0A8S9YAK8_9TREM|nr:hypothetical protein EG68_09471 [Paragonimus skrjabini miyazakii]
MLPSDFPYLPTLVGANATNLSAQSAVQAALLNAHNSSNPASSVQMFQHALLQESLRGMSVNQLLPFICIPSVGCATPVATVGIIPGSVQLAAVNSAACLNPLALFSSTSHLPHVGGTVNEASVQDTDAHTIIRAPVLYKNSTTVTSNPQPGCDYSNENEQSPPDRIVASYAAAAHAAALANHQPVSKAAENFLSLPRPRHPKRSRIRISNVATGAVSDTTLATVTTTVAPTSSTHSVFSTTDGVDGSAVKINSEGRRLGWSRIIDRIAGTVEYISPDDVHLRSRDEVFAYFRSIYPKFDDGKQYEDLVASCFNFEPTTEGSQLDDDLVLLSAMQPTSLSNSPPVSTGEPTCFTSESRRSTSCRISFNPNHITKEDFSLPIKRLRSAPSGESDDICSCKTVGEDECVESENSSTSISGDVRQTITSENNDFSLNAHGVSTSSSCQPSVSLECHLSDMTAQDAEQRISGASLIDQINPAQKDQAARLIVSELVSTSQVDCMSLVVSSSNSINPCASSGLSSSFCVTSPLSGDTIAKMTTETFTTASLQASTPSSSLAVIPSVVPHAGHSDGANSELQLLKLSGMAADPNLWQTCLSHNNANQFLAVNQMIAYSQLIQAQKSQQQLAAVMAALSADSATNNQAYMGLPSAPVVNPQSQFNPFLLTGHPQLNTAWAHSWPEFTAMGNALQQQQLITALQQQQRQLALASLLSRQQPTLLPAQLQSNSHHQQVVDPTTQLQTYLAALQRQLSPHGSQ